MFLSVASVQYALYSALLIDAIRHTHTQFSEGNTTTNAALFDKLFCIIVMDSLMTIACVGNCFY